MKIDGVIKVDANYRIGKATITFDDSKVTYDQLKDRLTKGGVLIQGEPVWVK